MEVINVRKKELNKIGYRDLEHWLENENHIYIGRNLSFYVKGAIKSKWANPFSVKKYGRDECLKKYREYILNDSKLMNELQELQNKILGCWCYPELCHGNILIKLLNNTPNVK